MTHEATSGVDVEGLVKRLNGMANRLQYHESGRYGIETIAPLREAATALAKLAAERDGALARVHDLDVVVENWRSLHREAKMRAKAAGTCASALEVERDRLREALEPFAEAAASYDPDEGDGGNVAWSHDFTIASLRRARAALSAKETTGE